MKQIFKNCKKHGQVEHEINKIVNKKIYYKCKMCKNYRQSDLRKNGKLKLVEISGGQCEICQYDKCHSALEFHHINPLTKTLEFSRIGREGKFENYIEELHKCIMVCANCHREIHEGLIAIEICSHSSTG